MQKYERAREVSASTQRNHAGQPCEISPRFTLLRPARIRYPFCAFSVNPFYFCARTRLNAGNRSARARCHSHFLNATCFATSARRFSSLEGRPSTVFCAKKRRRLSGVKSIRNPRQSDATTTVDFLTIVVFFSFYFSVRNELSFFMQTELLFSTTRAWMEIANDKRAVNLSACY